MKKFHRANMLTCFVQYSIKLFLMQLLYFQNVGGVSQPPYFIKGKIFSNGITLTTAKLFGFYSQGIQTILFAIAFN